MLARLLAVIVVMGASAAWTAAAHAQSTPYGGTAVALPGTLQAENFDNGGEGVAFHDTTGSNHGGKYRSGGVDIQPTSDAGGGWNVGWTRPGEWLQYTVLVTTTGIYNLELRLANVGTGATLHVNVDGVNVTGAIAVPNTGGWQVWRTTIKTGLSLTAGTRKVRLVFDTASSTNAGVGNVNWLRFVLQPLQPPPPPPCSYTVSPLVLDFPSGGGISTIAVTTQTGCQWYASSAATWATVTPSSATGTGTVTATIAPNAGYAGRGTTLTIAGTNIPVTQAPAPIEQTSLCDEPPVASQTVLRGTYNLLTCLPGPAPSGFKVVVRLPNYLDQVTDVGLILPAGPASASGHTPYLLPVSFQNVGVYGLSSIAYNYDATYGWAQTASTNVITVTVQ